MAHTPSVHNPTNFEPANYEVADYLDNRRPEYCGQDPALWAEEIKFWEADMERALGPDWRRKSHRCVHCGNTNVRWITAVNHLPTGDVVVFGADCTERLGFANRQAFKLAQLKAKAEAGHAKMKIWKARVAFLEANPAFAAAVEQAKNPVHAKNSFVADVITKLNVYGSLSERQVAAVIASLARDIEYAARKANEVAEVKGDAPNGRATVSGVILSVKDYESDFGVTTKMLVKLDNNSRVFVTRPAKTDANKGDRITFTATFTPKAEDKSFAFGKRPTFISSAPGDSTAAA